MPTYRYLCDKCGNEFEYHQSIVDDPLTNHKGCGGNVSKVFGAVGISFKGSGFYKTDAGAKAPAEKPAATGGADSKDSPKPTSAPDVSKTKPSPTTSEKKSPD